MKDELGIAIIESSEQLSAALNRIADAIEGLQETIAVDISGALSYLADQMQEHESGS